MTITKLLISNYGVSARQLVVVWLDKRGRLRMRAVVSRHLLAKHTSHELKLEAGQALLVLPAAHVAAKSGD